MVSFGHLSDAREPEDRKSIEPTAHRRSILAEAAAAKAEAEAEQEEREAKEKGEQINAQSPVKKKKPSKGGIRWADEVNTNSTLIGNVPPSPTAATAATPTFSKTPSQNGATRSLTSIRFFYRELPASTHGHLTSQQLYEAKLAVESEKPETEQQRNVGSDVKRIATTSGVHRSNAHVPHIVCDHLIDWRAPVDILTDPDLMLGRGAQSKEKDAQVQRERHSMARLYINSKQIPTEPDQIPLGEIGSNEDLDPNSFDIKRIPFDADVATPLTPAFAPAIPPSTDVISTFSALKGLLGSLTPVAAPAPSTTTTTAVPATSTPTAPQLQSLLAKFSVKRVMESTSSVPTSTATAPTASTSMLPPLPSLPSTLSGVNLFPPPPTATVAAAPTYFPPPPPVANEVSTLPALPPLPPISSLPPPMAIVSTQPLSMPPPPTTSYFPTYTQPTGPPPPPQHFPPPPQAASSLPAPAPFPPPPVSQTPVGPAPPPGWPASVPFNPHAAAQAAQDAQRMQQEAAAAAAAAAAVSRKRHAPEDTHEPKRMRLEPPKAPTPYAYMQDVRTASQAAQAATNPSKPWLQNTSKAFSKLCSWFDGPIGCSAGDKCTFAHVLKQNQVPPAEHEAQMRARGIMPAMTQAFQSHQQQPNQPQHQQPQHLPPPPQPHQPANTYHTPGGPTHPTHSYQPTYNVGAPSYGTPATHTGYPTQPQQHQPPMNQPPYQSNPPSQPGYLPPPSHGPPQVYNTNAPRPQSGPTYSFATPTPNPSPPNATFHPTTNQYGRAQPTPTVQHATYSPMHQQQPNGPIQSTGYAQMNGSSNIGQSYQPSMAPRPVQGLPPPPHGQQTNQNYTPGGYAMQQSNNQPQTMTQNWQTPNHMNAHAAAYHQPAYRA